MIISLINSFWWFGHLLGRITWLISMIQWTPNLWYFSSTNCQAHMYFGPLNQFHWPSHDSSRTKHAQAHKEFRNSTYLLRLQGIYKRTFQQWSCNTSHSKHMKNKPATFALHDCMEQTKILAWNRPTRTVYRLSMAWQSQNMPTVNSPASRHIHIYIQLFLHWRCHILAAYTKDNEQEISVYNH